MVSLRDRFTTANKRSPISSCSASRIPHLDFELHDLFFHLFHRPRRVRPVEADTSRPFLQPKRHQQWGQGGWETTEGPAPGSPLPFFHPLPSLMIRRLRVAE